MKSIEELQIEQAELSAERQRLAGIKVGYQAQLAELNAKCSTWLQPGLFRKLQFQRQDLIGCVQAIEQSLGLVKQRIRELHVTVEVRKRKDITGVTAVRRLVAMRDRWHAFSMDSEKHQKAREVAWDVSQEIAGLLKEHFAQRDTEVS